ncbi:MAG: Spy/CpxP family protein refolding chaperone [Nitrospira sp.]|nr:Spy/CpxP family protein refolding chaperone [Nitrospira sp.]
MKTGPRKRSLLLLAILSSVAVTFAVTTMSWADMPHFGHDKRPNAADFIWHVLKAKERLGLSEEQETRLRATVVTFKKEDVRKTAEIELAEIDLHQLLHQPEKQAGYNEIESVVRRMYGLEADRRLASIRAVHDARSVLTPEQQKKVRELHEQRHESALPPPPPFGAFPPPPPHGFMER